MNLAELNKVAEAMVAPGRGILAADESSGTIKKRFDAIGVESTADSRRDYRELLFRSSEAMSKYISGVILYDETIRQKAKDGTALVKLIENAGAIPGIKVDKGTKPLPFCPGEVITEGLDGLRDAAADGLLDRVLVYCPDRLARNYVHQHLLIEELDRRGVAVHFVERPIGERAEDRLLVQMQGVIAEYERAKIQERGRRGKRHARTSTRC